MENKKHKDNGLGRPKLASPLHKLVLRVNPSTKQLADEIGHAKVRDIIAKAMEDGYDGRS